jgi:hypothetical protein
MLEPVKANMASAAVALGLMPTLFAFIGSNTVETAILSLKRPVLGFLLLAASPTVAPTRTFDYRSPATLLRQRLDAKKAKVSTGWRTLLISSLEYAVAIGALANVAHNTWQLCERVVFAYSVEIEYAPIIFVFVAIALHIAGIAVLYLSIKFESDVSRKQSVAALIKHELTPCASHAQTKLIFKPESYFFILLSWLTSIGTILYLFYSTYLFSGALFITLASSQIIIVRYLVSILSCRAILMYELSGMRHNVQVDEIDIQRNQEPML